MKLFLRMILIGVLTYFLSTLMPWWILVVVCFVVGLLIPGGGFNTFTSGFLGVAIVWMGYAWKLDTVNQSEFSTIILDILPLGDPIMLIVFTGLLGGFMGGLSCMTGSFLRKSPKNKKSSGYYS